MAEIKIPPSSSKTQALQFNNQNSLLNDVDDDSQTQLPRQIYVVNQPPPQPNPALSFIEVIINSVCVLLSANYIARFIDKHSDAAGKKINKFKEKFQDHPLTRKVLDLKNKVTNTKNDLEVKLRNLWERFTNPSNYENRQGIKESFEEKNNPSPEDLKFFQSQLKEIDTQLKQASKQLELEKSKLEEGNPEKIKDLKGKINALLDRRGFCQERIKELENKQGSAADKFPDEEPRQIEIVDDTEPEASTVPKTEEKAPEVPPTKAQKPKPKTEEPKASTLKTPQTESEAQSSATPQNPRPRPKLKPKTSNPATVAEGVEPEPKITLEQSLKELEEILPKTIDKKYLNSLLEKGNSDLLNIGKKLTEIYNSLDPKVQETLREVEGINTLTFLGKPPNLFIEHTLNFGNNTTKTKEFFRVAGNFASHVRLNHA